MIKMDNKYKISKKLYQKILKILSKH